MNPLRTHSGRTAQAILLSAITISILFLVFTAPNGYAMIGKRESTAAMRWLLDAIVHAQQVAALKGYFVTLCPGPGDSRCGENWSEGVIVFTDENGNGKIDGDDFILERFSSPTPHADVRWQSLKDAQRLHITNRGMRNRESGTFTYCPPYGAIHFSWQLNLSPDGRIGIIESEEVEERIKWCWL